jgi:protein gp37
MGCQGCELYPSPTQVRKSFLEALLKKYPKLHQAHVKASLEQLFGARINTELWHERRQLVASVMKAFRLPSHDVELVKDLIEKSMKCYAAILHFRHGQDHTQPNKKTNKGYARTFESPTLFPGRTADAARWKDLFATDRLESPWLAGLPRLIFVSDMGDALSENVSFEFLKAEIVDVASSSAGSRHIWQWLTKRPAKMAQFSAWLETNYGPNAWPDNLIAMTSITSRKTVGRVNALRQVGCRFRGLSVEPLWESITLPLAGISWVICGGESGGGAEPFDITWAKDIHQQCADAKVAFFLKQLGAAPFDCGTPIKLRDKHGGNWDEWPAELKIREFPVEWYARLSCEQIASQASQTPVFVGHLAQV